MKFMNPLKIFFLFSIFAFCCDCCYGRAAQENKFDEQDSSIGKSKTNNFDSTIVSISRKSLGNETYDALFALPEFIDVYEHGILYKSDCIIFLSDNTFSEHEKKIAICTLQRLILAEYVQFCQACKDLFDRKIIAESLLSWAINPNFSNRYNIAKNYKDKQVKDLLTGLEKDNAISEDFKKELSQILSGKLARVINDSHSR